MPLISDSVPIRSSPVASSDNPGYARRDRPWRKIVESGALLLVAGLFCRTWCVEGLFVPVGIPSGSMAPALLGPHCRFLCRDCGRTFACGADVPRIGPRRVCPGCGSVAEIAAAPDVRKGDRVVLLRSAYAGRSPRRWEIVAFHDPSRPSRMAVKRVVGLPGESVEIRRGNVFINGEIQRKPWAVQQAMAVLVHDGPGKGSDKNTTDLRWAAETSDSRWIRSGDGFRHPGPRESADARPDGAEPIDWLVYHHQRWIGDSLAAGPVTDELSYNQWRSQRSDEIQPVVDLILQFRARAFSGDGRLVVRAAVGKDRVEAWIGPTSGSCEFRFNGRTVQRGRIPVAAKDETMDVAFSLVDRQLVLVLDGRPAIGRLLLPADESWDASEHPLAIGSAGLGVEIGQIRVLRDVYYSRPTGVLARWGFDRPARLGAGEFFVLGDNSRISEDSRSWPTGPAV
ncbi:MAG TPA: signal peptidase I, partial [Thermoguttaceae bacterium]|nr:signal peptidase I [Thermoguttaceae bacterium]